MVVCCADFGLSSGKDNSIQYYQKNGIQYFKILSMNFNLNYKNNIIPTKGMRTKNSDSQDNKMNKNNYVINYYSNIKKRRYIKKEKIKFLILFKCLIIQNLICPFLSSYIIKLKTSVDTNNFYNIINLNNINPPEVYVNSQLVSADISGIYLKVQLSGTNDEVKLVWSNVISKYTRILNDNIFEPFFEMTTNAENILHELTTILVIQQKPVNAEELFKDCNIIKSIDFQEFNMSIITNMKGMFHSCTSLEEIHKFDPTNVEDLSYLFYDCESLSSIEYKSNTLGY